MDSLFVVPFLAGVPLALVLPLVGLFLRLRDEWLATLGLAHLSAAGVLIALAAGLPGFSGALAGALVGAGARQAVRGHGNSAYGLMILAGWAATLLIAANTTLGEALAHGLMDGQLWFAGGRDLAVGLLVMAIALPALARLAPRLVAARFFPDRERANGLPAWRWHLGFDLLVALAVAAGTATLGLMATFAFVFVPPWIAFRRAVGGRHAGWIAVGTGVAAYGAAFSLALAFDQPFGPTLVAVLTVAWPFAAFADFRNGIAHRERVC